MDKYFKESDVMAVLNKELMYCPLDCEWLVRHIIVSMSSLKPADAKSVVKGKWINRDAAFMECSACQALYLKQIDSRLGKAHWANPNFCPNCGADMRSNHG